MNNLGQSKKANESSEKNAVYRFLNKSTFAWRIFLLFLSVHTIKKVTNLTNHDRPSFDHTSKKMRFYKDFRMLTLGWSDGVTFIPVDFSLLSSKKIQINGIYPKFNKRILAYKRRVEASQYALKGKIK